MPWLVCLSLLPSCDHAWCCTTVVSCLVGRNGQEEGFITALLAVADFQRSCVILLPVPRCASQPHHVVNCRASHKTRSEMTQVTIDVVCYKVLGCKCSVAIEDRSTIYTLVLFYLHRDCLLLISRSRPRVSAACKQTRCLQRHQPHRLGIVLRVAATQLG